MLSSQTAPHHPEMQQFFPNTPDQDLIHSKNAFEVDIPPIRVASASVKKMTTSWNPFKGMFHLFISYRTAPRDANWVSKLYDTLCLDATISHQQGKRLPLITKTQFPGEFNCDAFAQQKILNVFWDKVCLTDGYKWEGDGTQKGGGFIGALVQSVVFVPVLSWYADEEGKEKGSIAQMLQASDEHQDNVLVEFLVAKFLYECSREGDDTSLLPCSVVLPLIVDDVFTKSKTLLPSILMASNKKAFELLTAAGYDPPRAMIDREYVDLTTKQHPWSPCEVVKFFLSFQGVITYLCGANDRDVKECSTRIMGAIVRKLSTCKSLTLQLESNNPLGRELRQFLESKFMGHYLHCLDSHGVKSIRVLSQLDKHCAKEISAEMAQSTNSSSVAHFSKLSQLVVDAKKTKEAQPLNVRLESFIDEDASWSTALTSTCAVDLLMRRKFYLFIMIVGPLIMIGVGVYLLLTPTSYTRVFSGSAQPESYTSRGISTAALMFTGAIGLGPLCLCCSYLGSPRKGRYAVAYGFYLACFFVQCAGFYYDNANLEFCRFVSLETDDASIQNCVTAYAIAFAFRIFFFFGLFLVVLKKQEYYWDSFCVGCCLMLACNFILYVMTKFSVVNVFITVAVIALIASLNVFVRFKRNKSRYEARKKIQDDAELYQKTWKAVSRGDALITKNESLIGLWKDSPLHPVEISGTKIQNRQDSEDFEFLYFLAEFGHEPFNDMVTSWCSGRHESGLSDGRQFFNESASNGSTLFRSPPTVIRGPIKSVQRSIEKVLFADNCCFGGEWQYWCFARNERSIFFGF
jgi:hypothetical protein